MTVKRILATAALLLAASTLFAGPQFRAAANAYTPLENIPTTAEGWDRVVWPTDSTQTGWHWEVILNRMGFGMHYGVELTTTESIRNPYQLDWKGDFFLSYHLFGGGSVVDPFVELGWGNAGSAYVNSTDDVGYPDWEDRVHDGSATALSLYTYVAGGVALDLNGLLLGARLSYLPAEMTTPIPDNDIGFYALNEFELGIFAGIALGSHDRRDRHERDRRW